MKKQYSIKIRLRNNGKKEEEANVHISKAFEILFRETEKMIAEKAQNRINHSLGDNVDCRTCFTLKKHHNWVAKE